MGVNEKAFPVESWNMNFVIPDNHHLNAQFLRNKLFDYIDIVVAPVLIGGKDTASLIDGKSLLSTDELNSMGILELEKAEVMEDSYIRLRYKVR